MTTLPKARTAAVLLLTIALPVAWAQTSTGKPVKPAAKPATAPTGRTLSGSAAGGGKMMTRDELRSCLKRLDDLNQNAKALEAQRPGLDSERDELKAAGEALKTERAELDRQFQPVNEWQGKARAHTADVEAFNKRNAAVAQAPRNEQEQLVRELKLERDRLEKAREGLAAEEARIVPDYKALAAAHNEKVRARDARAIDWNARNAAVVDAAAKQQEARATWLGECGNRPYLEDDEKAIKAGK
jgi:chromosome segregation ATPase